MFTLNPNVSAKCPNTFAWQCEIIWCEWAVESRFIYGVDQYVSVDLIETKTVALHTNILLIRFMCENNARWCNKIYTFSVEEITELYPFLK